MKEEKNQNAVDKRWESDFYHGKSLEIGCTFLPSECPLVNHILMSYQKHHSPTSDVIDENAEQSPPIKVIWPMLGIESNKHQPIIRDQTSLGVKIQPVKIASTDYKDSFHKFREEMLERQIKKAQLAWPVLINKKVQATMSDYAYGSNPQSHTGQ